MSSSSQKIVSSIDFDLHTDGDADFKRELITLMIDNVKELQEVLHKGIKENDLKAFRECSHKIAPTLNIINDKEFIGIIEALKHQTNLSKREHSVELFNKMCDDLIRELKKEGK